MNARNFTNVSFTCRYWRTSAAMAVWERAHLRDF